MMKRILLFSLLLGLLVGCSGSSGGKTLVCSGTIEGSETTMTFVGEKPVKTMTMHIVMNAEENDIDETSFALVQGIIVSSFESMFSNSTAKVELKDGNVVIDLEIPGESLSELSNLTGSDTTDIVNMSHADIKASMESKSGISCK